MADAWPRPWDSPLHDVISDLRDAKRTCRLRLVTGADLPPAPDACGHEIIVWAPNGVGWCGICQAFIIRDEIRAARP